jgi:hypothetical protein
MGARGFGGGFWLYGIDFRMDFQMNLALARGRRRRTLELFPLQIFLFLDQKRLHVSGYKIAYARDGVCPLSLYRGEGGVQGKKP